MANRNPLAYTGRVLATTNRAGDAQFSSSEFSISNGVVSLNGTGVLKNVTLPSGSVTPSAGILQFANGSAMNIGGSGNTVTFAVVDATDSVKGAASFVAADFSVSSGAVSLVDTAVKSVTSDSGSATPASHAFGILGTNGITTTGLGENISVTGVNASDSQIGVASFALEDFDVTAGNVALKESLPSVANVTLSNAEIKALATTPIELVAAPGAGKVVQLVGALIKLNAGSEALTESGDNMGIKYTDASGVQVCTNIECTGFIDQTVDTYTNAVPSADAIVAATGAENQALVLDNLGSNFAGNASADATMDIQVMYRVVAI